MRAARMRNKQGDVRVFSIAHQLQRPARGLLFGFSVLAAALADDDVLLKWTSTVKCLLWSGPLPVSTYSSFSFLCSARSPEARSRTLKALGRGFSTFGATKRSTNLRLFHAAVEINGGEGWLQRRPGRAVLPARMLLSAASLYKFPTPSALEKRQRDFSHTREARSLVKLSGRSGQGEEVVETIISARRPPEIPGASLQLTCSFPSLA